MIRQITDTSKKKKKFSENIKLELILKVKIMLLKINNV